MAEFENAEVDEHEVGQLVGMRMRQEVAGIESSVDLMQTLRRRHTRRTWGVRMVAALPAVAVFATVGSIALAGTSGAPAVSTAKAPSSTAAPMLDAAYVTAHTSQALGNLADYVEECNQSSTNGYSSRIWIDPVSGRDRFNSYDPHGRLLYADSISGPIGNQPTALVVDYSHRAWWTYQMAAAPTPAGSGAVRIGPFDDPADIRDALTSGSLQLIGPEVIDGQKTLHLRVTNLPKAMQTTIDLWVDATTYLPTRLVTTKGPLRARSDYTWLPRTTKNLAPLDLVAPAGFTHRSHPIEGSSDGPGVG